MRRHEIEKELKEHGFRPGREARHGQFWIDDDGKMLLVQRDYSADWRAALNFKAELNRILKARPPALPKPKEPEMRPAIAPPKANISPIFAKPEPARKRTVRRFDGVTRERIWSRIVEMHAAGKTTSEMAVALQDAGFKMADGSEIDIAYVNSAIFNMRTTERIKDAPAPVTVTIPSTATPAQTAQAVAAALPPPAPKRQILPTWVQDLITDPNMSAEEKIDALSRFCL